MFIPREKCREGAKLCLENAIRLTQDARLLFEKERYLASTCMASYSIEEVGKGLALANSKAGLSDLDWQKLSKGKAHKHKLKEGWIQAAKLLENDPVVQELLKRKPLFKTESGDIFADAYFMYRARSLYVDWTERGWTSPIHHFPLEDLGMVMFSLGGSFVACRSLAEKLGEDSSKIVVEHKEFHKEMVRRLQQKPVRGTP